MSSLPWFSIIVLFLMAAAMLGIPVFLLLGDVRRDRRDPGYDGPD